MNRVGRPSAIFELLHEARCDVCGTWIRTPVIRFHYETEHPAAKPATLEEREIPIPLRIAEYVEAGNYLSDAAAACGVDRTTVTRWMALGGAIAEELGPEADPIEIPAERRIFFVFRVAVERAREAARVHRIRRIAKDPDWRAQAWILERTHPAEFGRVDKLRVGGDAEAGPVRIIQEESDPDFIGDVMRIYAEQGVVPGVESGNGKSPAKRARKEVHE